MPLFRGATSKAILAWIPERKLTRLFLDNAAEVHASGLGATREEFLGTLKAIRRHGYSLTASNIATIFSGGTSARTLCTC